MVRMESAADVVVLDAGQLGGEDAEAAGGHRGGEGNEAGLVHAEMVDAVEHDEGGRVGVIAWACRAAREWGRWPWGW